MKAAQKAKKTPNLKGKFVAISTPRSAHIGKIGEVLDDLGEKLKLKLVDGKELTLSRSSVTTKDVYMINSNRSIHRHRAMQGVYGVKDVKGSLDTYLIGKRIGGTTTVQVLAENVIPISKSKDIRKAISA